MGKIAILQAWGSIVTEEVWKEAEMKHRSRGLA